MSPALANACQYRAAEWAHRLHRSLRWLELYCETHDRPTPHQILAGLRCRRIQQLARAGIPGKIICAEVHLANLASLCRALKRDSGQTLRELRRKSS